MFVQYLNKEQQAAMLHFANAVMMADGYEDAAEHQKMDVLQAQVAADVQPQEIDDADLPALFGDRQSRIALLLEVIGMGYADGTFDPRESAIVKKIADALSISDSELEDLNTWVVRQMNLLREANLMMEA